MEMHIKSKTHGTHIIYFDISNWDKVKDYGWYIDKRGSNFYARAKVNNKLVYMHRLLTELNTGMDVDHIDGNGLNNTSDNLRICTHSENNRNQRTRMNNTSGFKGVSFYKPKSQYRSYIVIRNKQKHLGYYDNAVDVAKAYDAAAIDNHGSFARLNFA